MKKTYFIVLVLVLAACKKEAADIMPFEPAIELVTIGPGTVVEFEQSVTLRFSYKDGNGDLGRSDPDDHSLWIKDSRLNTADGYHIRPLAPPDTEVPIQGELTVQLSPLFLLGNGAQEVMTYSFYIVDRAGNRSNEITSSPITIHAGDTI
ncbi:MAG: hypothetical protein R2818_10865 [Flavobacteriales bacterium]